MKYIHKQKLSNLLFEIDKKTQTIIKEENNSIYELDVIFEESIYKQTVNEDNDEETVLLEADRAGDGAGAPTTEPESESATAPEPEPESEPGLGREAESEDDVEDAEDEQAEPGIYKKIAIAQKMIIGSKAFTDLLSNLTEGFIYQKGLIFLFEDGNDTQRKRVKTISINDFFYRLYSEITNDLSKDKIVKEFGADFENFVGYLCEKVCIELLDNKDELLDNGVRLEGTLNRKYKLPKDKDKLYSDFAFNMARDNIIKRSGERNVHPQRLKATIESVLESTVEDIVYSQYTNYNEDMIKHLRDVYIHGIKTDEKVKHQKSQTRNRILAGTGAVLISTLAISTGGLSLLLAAGIPWVVSKGIAMYNELGIKPESFLDRDMNDKIKELRKQEVVKQDIAQLRGAIQSLAAQAKKLELSHKKINFNLRSLLNEKNILNEEQLQELKYEDVVKTLNGLKICSFKFAPKNEDAKNDLANCVCDLLEQYYDIKVKSKISFSNSLIKSQIDSVIDPNIQPGQPVIQQLAQLEKTRIDAKQPLTLQQITCVVNACGSDTLKEFLTFIADQTQQTSQFLKDINDKKVYLDNLESYIKSIKFDDLMKAINSNNDQLPKINRKIINIIYNTIKVNDNYLNIKNEIKTKLTSNIDNKTKFLDNLRDKFNIENNEDKIRKIDNLKSVSSVLYDDSKDFYDIFIKLCKHFNISDDDLSNVIFHELTSDLFDLNNDIRENYFNITDVKMQEQEIKEKIKEKIKTIEIKKDKENLVETFGRVGSVISGRVSDYLYSDKKINKSVKYNKNSLNEEWLNIWGIRK